jgi:putative salt-induced outer membrane protein YdiY
MLACNASRFIYGYPMAMHFRIIINSWIFLLLCLPFAAEADEILLRNGDRLSGEIVSMEKELLVLKSEIVEERISIELKDIVCIRSQRKLPAVFKNEEMVIGTLSCPEDGMIAIDSENLGILPPLALNRLQSINPSTYSGFFNLGGDLNRGNSNTSSVNYKSRFQVKTHKHRFTVDITHNFGEANGDVTIRNSSGSLKYDFFSGEKVYSYAQSLNEQDPFANLNLRSTDGLGMGYQFSDTRKLNLFAELGISFFNEDVIIGNDTRIAAGRWAVGFDWEFVPRRIWLYHHEEGYYNFEEKTYVMKSDQGMRIPLRDNFSLNFEVDYRINSAPQAGDRNSDMLMLFGLTYNYAYW